MPAIATAIIPRANVPVYPYIQPGVPDFNAIGLQSIIAFNGLQINDRFRPDRYFVKKITGLGQADIRENRIDRPSDHGKIPYAAFYKGATITIEGEIQAGSMGQSTRMYRDLEAALGSLVEYPMKFKWYDVRDEFSEPLTSNAFWTTLNSGTLSFLGVGVLRFTKAGMAYYALRKYMDARVSSRVVIGDITKSGSTFITIPILDSENYVKLSVVNSAGVLTLLLSYISAGSEKAISGSVSMPTQYQGASVWLALQKVGDEVIGNAYLEDPTVASTEAIASTSAVLTGSISEKYGMEISGMAGVGMTGAELFKSWVIGEFRVDSIWPGDIYLNARSVAPLSPQITRESTITSRFVTPFQFAVRASNAAKRSPVTISASLGVTIQQLLGRIYTYNLTFDSNRDYTHPIDASGNYIQQKAEQQAICVNRGTWISKPVIVLKGGLLDPVITNLTTGQSLALNGTIAANDYLIIDCARHKIQNSAGADQFGLFDPESQWIYLIKGDNRIIMTARAEVGSPKCTIQWQHTWL